MFVDSLVDLVSSSLISLGLVSFLLGLAFGVLEFRGLAKLGSKDLATISKHYVQIQVKSIKHVPCECSWEVLQTGLLHDLFFLAGL